MDQTTTSVSLCLPLLLILTEVHCEVSLRTIFKESKKAVEDYNLEESIDVEFKYYLTDVKGTICN